MVINLYKCKSDFNTIGKTLESERIINGTLKTNFDVMSPYFEVSFNPIGYNYCYVPTLKRYYFINDYRIIRNSLFGISLKVDVLETYKDTIKAATADMVIKDGDSYSENSGYVTDVRHAIRKVDYEYTFKKSDSMVLVTVVG